MPTNRRKRDRARRPDRVPYGIYSYLLALPYDPLAHDGSGRLETFQRSRTELLDSYWLLFTAAERRKARAIERAENERREAAFERTRAAMRTK